MQKRGSDREILAMALLGFEVQRKRVVEAIANLRAEQSSRSAQSKTNQSSSAKGTQHLSAEGRERIAAAQRKRWRKMKRRMAEAATAKSNPTAKRRKARTGKDEGQSVQLRPRQAGIKPKRRDNPSKPSNVDAKNAALTAQTIAAVSAPENQAEGAAAE